MASPTTDVVAVGDDLQCIYQWRGSDVSRILAFTKEFKDATVHRLPTNYRSRPHIVEARQHNRQRHHCQGPQEGDEAGAPPSHRPSPPLALTPIGRRPGTSSADIILRFANNGAPWRSMAILLRSVNSWGQDFVTALTRANIPVICPRLSRGGAFINQVAIPILDWLREEHPDPKNEAEEVKAEAAATGLWASLQPWVKATNPHDTFWAALNDWLDKINDKKSDAYDIRGRFYDLLNECRIHIHATDNSLMVGLGIASQIIRSVEEMHKRRIDGQSRRTPRGVVSEVDDAMRRRNEDFGESIPIEQVGDGVLVSTVHQSKGLEWPIVILPTLVERRFPVAPSKHGTSFPDKIAARYGTSIEDERRLFYVAATRAKERLILLDPVANNPKRRSPFLTDLQSRGLKPYQTPAEVPEAVWQIPKDDLKPDPAPPVRTGLSDLLLYADCPFQYRTAPHRGPPAIHRRGGSATDRACTS